MKKIALILSILMIVLLTGCTQASPTPTAEIPAQTSSPQLPTVILATPTSETPVLTLTALKNTSYFLPDVQQTVTLTDGSYTNGSSTDPLTVTLLPQVAFGDMNGDGSQDAAVLLAENRGGSGTFVSLAVVFDQKGSLVHTNNSVVIDDRPVIEDLTLQNGKVSVKALIHGPNDPMTNPTLETSLTYAVSNGDLWMTRMTTTPQSGSERSINFESPASGSVVSGSVEVKGNMPIAPFENTLGYTISDPGGINLASGSFMVSSPDVGGIATFDQTIDLAGIPSGKVIRLMVFEADMSGFRTYNALEVVELTVK
jgi:hypothetical protein